VIWIGTVERLDLVAAQALVLETEPAHGMDAVVAWAATDELYRCGENSTAQDATHRRQRARRCGCVCK